MAVKQLEAKEGKNIIVENENRQLRDKNLLLAMKIDSIKDVIIKSKNNLPFELDAMKLQTSAERLKIQNLSR